MSDDTVKLRFKPPRGPQLEYLKAATRRTNGGIAVTHFVGGRRGGKTTGGIILLAKSAFEINAGRPHLWTEPTNDDCLKIFLRTWQAIVPKELYSLKLKPLTITTINGTVIDVVSREIKNSNSEPGRGTEYAFINFDELAKDPTSKGWMHMYPTLSDPHATQLICSSTSTPRLGWYKDAVTDGTAEVIYGSSYDNVYIDQKAIDAWKSHYSARLTEQEIYAKWIALSKLAWEEADLTQDWPDGNLHPHIYDENLPYVLAGDIGVQSSWLIMQKVYDRFREKVIDVCVAEFTPNNSNTEAACREIDSIYGEPHQVIMGSDFGTRDVNTGMTAHRILVKRIGWRRAKITPVRAWHVSKDIQHSNACMTLLDGNGHRRFCVSRGLRKHHKQSPERGIEAVLTQDTWSEQYRQGEWLPKDKRDKGGSALEDTRDAFQYWAIETYPPHRNRRAGMMVRGEIN